MDFLFDDRRQAGILLGEELKLQKKEWKDTVILALPRGGVPIAYEIGKMLKRPFDVLIVRKIGHPLNPEYGIGAIAEGSFYWVDPTVNGVAPERLQEIVAREREEIHRRIEKYRDGRTLPSLEGKTVLLVDDGLATGVTARIASHYAKANGALKTILVVPVCSAHATRVLKNDFDEILCLDERELFIAVGHSFRRFNQLTDEEVLSLLGESRQEDFGHPEETEDAQRERRSHERLLPREDGDRRERDRNLKEHDGGR